ncbi:MAG: hypothetical protein EON58_06580 [Alphaproteobacteria bacterium]|nr:MAG: hypothetical protein EON58_06580 [Alphaproteobacteria bacterium]
MNASLLRRKDKKEMLKNFFSRFGTTDGKAHPSIQITQHANEVSIGGEIEQILPLRFKEKIINGERYFDLENYAFIVREK